MAHSWDVCSSCHGAGCDWCAPIPRSPVAAPNCDAHRTTVAIDGMTFTRTLPPRRQRRLRR